MGSLLGMEGATVRVVALTFWAIDEGGIIQFAEARWFVSAAITVLPRIELAITTIRTGFI